MMPLEACCTCATLLSAVPLVSSTEKPLPENRRLECCGRTICGDCIQNNARFRSYCPYCQTSGRSPLVSRPRDKHREVESEEDEQSNPAAVPSPPPYSTLSTSTSTNTKAPDPPYPPPPPYSASPPASHPPISERQKQQQLQQHQPQPPDEPSQQKDYIVHHLRHTHPVDTLPSLSLRYGIPIPVLQQHNNLPQGADLLAARRTFLIPKAHCAHPNPTSLSPHPPESPDEIARKITIRRWMVACKEADYDMALVYLEEAGYDLDEAVGRYVEDEAWEREHSLDKHKHKRKDGGGKQKGPAKRGWGWGWGLSSRVRG
ncbi:LysM domain-containing protein [Madurella fahalii]|uniref:LysM domain-containing protein n=1 Tax=Madurella fahalii TaxID=1157608 RepID=A0ABQ0GS21_9PEZI